MGLFDSDAEEGDHCSSSIPFASPLFHTPNFEDGEGPAPIQHEHQQQPEPDDEIRIPLNHLPEAYWEKELLVPGMKPSWKHHSLAIQKEGLDILCRSRIGEFMVRFFGFCFLFFSKSHHHDFFPFPFALPDMLLQGKIVYPEGGDKRMDAHRNQHRVCNQ
jgi:hypothetical protein